MDRHSGVGPPPHLRGRPVSGLEAAHAIEYFEPFLNATTLKNILGYHRSMCEFLHLKPNVFPHFYPKLRANLTSWRAKALWKKFDARASHKCYGKGKTCNGTRVLIIGGGPCGLRTAIEAQLLGAKVVVIEKRDRLSRNNVLHLWPFVIEDLRMLGAKKFFGKFCAGAIDHISIRQLQCILLKVALLLGVEVHTEVSFEKLLEPSSTEKTGWRADIKPENHPVSQYEFDVIIGADGKRNTLQGFKRKEFRGKLAIAITANFINKKSEAEARVEEISGVAFIFNQKFFKDLQEETRIDLENIVYYKDDTHYFVMTAKKASLLEKGVIKQDLSDTEKLLAPDNVDRDALQNYARQAADFSTNYQLPHLEFAVNHYGQPDVAMFDFTSMYAAEYASKVVERHGSRLLMILVGDSLLEPFWPTGSGCARGFLSSLDAAWAIRSYCSGQMTPLDVLAERESIYRLLAQTTPDNLNKDWKAYTLDPSTRYPNLNKSVVTPHQTVCLYDTDNADSIDKMKRASLEAVSRQEHVAKKRRRGNVDNEVLVSWLSEQLREHEDLHIADVSSAFRDGKTLCAIIHHYRPDLLDYGAIKDKEPAKCNQLAMDILEKDLGLPPFMTGEEITNTEDYLAMATYLTQVYDTFRGEIPHIKHPKLNAVEISGSKEYQIVGFPVNSKKSSILDNHLSIPYRKIISPKASLGKVKRGGKNFCKIFGLKTFSPLEIIRKHLLMKRQQLSLVLSKPSKITGPMIKSELNSPKMPRSLVSNIPNDTEEIVHSAKVRTYSKKSFDSSTQSINIEIIHQSSGDNVTRQNVEYKSSLNLVKITSTGFFSKPSMPKNVMIKDSIRELVVLRGDSVSASEAHRCPSPRNRPVKPTVEQGEKNVKVHVRSRQDNMRSPYSPRSDKWRMLDLKKARKKRKSRTHLSVKAKPCLTPADAQIINSLGTSVIETSKVKKTCPKTSNNDKDYQRKQKFSLQDSLRNLIVNRQKLYGDYRASIKPNEQFCGEFSKLDNSLEDQRPAPNNMDFYDDDETLSPQIYTRVQKWISQHDFKADEMKKDPEGETLVTCDIPSDITSVTRAHVKKKGEYDDIKVEERTDVVRCECPGSSSQEDFVELVKNLKDVKTLTVKENKTTIKPITKYSQYNMKSVSAPPANFSVIVEGEESELPESNKRSEFSFKSIKTTHHQPTIPNSQPSRPSSRHKRHAEVMAPKPCSIDRKQRKRRTLERIGPSVEERQKTLDEIAANRHDRQSKKKQQRRRQTEQFIKSMQMLQANCKPDCSEPFEDYSIFLYRQTAPKFEDRVKDLEKQFTYVPDYDNKISGLKPLANTNAEEDIASKIRSLEDKWNNRQPAEKKPKDLMRAIGKIETSDWNIKQIEKKILENKIGKPSTLNADKERVPRWSKEEFRARQTKMEKKHLDKQDSSEAKYADIDRNIKQLELKLKEGTNRELGQNKVATITEKLVSKAPQEKEKPVEKPVQPKPMNLPVQSGSEFCHFCGKRVYLMEKLTAEGRFFHHGCFKCQYCHSQLRLGSYMFDRDGQYGYRFFCIHHYGMQGELPRPTKVARKPSQRGTRDVGRSPQKKALSGVAGVDLLDRVQTPERIEFSNLSTAGNISSDHEEHLSQMDEDEWTDKNFGASCNELDESDDSSSSSISDTDSDDEDAFDDALEQPITKEGTMKWAERWKNSYRKGRRSDSDGYSSSDHSSYYENSTDDSDSDTATEGEEEIRARELRRQEVRVEPPVVQTDTGTDTEMVSEESSSESSSEVHNSATEISTDSEFAQDDPTPTREVPSITLNDFHVTKTRGSGKSNYPKRIQVTSGYIQRPRNEKPRPNPNIELKLSPLVPSTPNFKKPAPVLLPRTEGYALNRTQSTGGIAAKVSLELKKKYLLGESGTNSIQKSGSASTLDTKFKSFQNTISDCQKLLKPAPEVSASMQMFCNKLDERHSPILSPQGVFAFSGPKDTPMEESKPDLPPPDITITTITENKDEKVQESESQSRPRSPVHEASIPVPSIDWSKRNQSQSSDSLSLSGSASEIEATNFHIPRVEVHAAKESDKEEMALDSLCPEARETEPKAEATSERSSSSVNQEQSKSITSEKKSLNQPKSLPNLESVLPEIHKALHVKIKSDKDDSPEDNKSLKTMSGKSSPEGTTALTETELSDWARDENVSDSIELDISQDSDKKKVIKMAHLSEFDEAVNQHVCGKDSKEMANKTILTEAMNNALSGNLDHIEYMDTGTETSSDDGIVDSQNGYVLFKNEDDLAEDSLNPHINDVFEAKNVYLTKKEAEKLERNAGYCEVVTNAGSNFGGEVIDLNQADLERLKQKQTLTDHEEDSLVIVETGGTTTEENTCSDSTVKNITEICPDVKANKDKPSVKIENLQKQRLEEKLAKVKAEQALLKQKETKEKENIENNLQYEEHCQRLQSKVEFGNARDSIDIRKSRRRSKTDSPQKPDLIQEEKERASPPKDITLNLTPVIRPDVLYKKENIKKERDVNKKLIEEMVMNKMKAENKSLERKKRNRSNMGSLSPCRPYNVQKSNTTDVVSQINLSNLDKSANSVASSTYATPDLLSNSIPLQNVVPDINSSNEQYSTPMSLTPKHNPNRPLSVFSTFTDVRKLPETPLTNPENYSMPDIRKNLFADDFKTPKAPPRYNRPSDVAKTAEKMKEHARARARLLSNEDLGLSPEDKMNKLREKVNRRAKENEHLDVHVLESIESLVLNTERRNSLLYSNDTLSKKRTNSFRRSKSGDSETNNGINARPKSISGIPKNLSVSKSIQIESEGNKKICKSDPNLLDTNNSKSKKKSKDRERRKSITKLIAGIFTKKSPSGAGTKGLFAKLSPKSKAISKSLTSLDLCKHETVIEEPKPRKSLSEMNIKKREPTPPPIPPLPANYTMKATDESSDGEVLDGRVQDRSSCDTLDQSGILETSMSGRRSGKARRVSRQVQLKRHRMAQEIQRKLEETEVKTRELEQRGVEVEKALRGEDEGRCVKEESELLQEWFDLMRDRTELRRYEKELMVRAQELELEDRHSRLQMELRERLECNENKTEEDLKAEESIINEMMNIVAKRDTLIGVLEEDRLRYSHEDKDLEEQMLAKGLMLTPIQKTPEK